MVVLEALSNLFRLDFSLAGGLFFENLLLLLFFVAVILFLVPKNYRLPATMTLAVLILLASIDLSFFVGVFQWNFFAVTGALVASAAAGAKWFERWVLLFVTLAAFGPLLMLSGWVFAKDLLLFVIVFFILQIVYAHSAWKKRLDPFLANGILLLMSWFFTFHW